MSIEAKIPNIYFVPPVDQRPAAVQVLSQIDLDYLQPPPSHPLLDDGQPTPVPQTPEDLCPSEELICSLEQNPDGQLQLRVEINPGGSLNITDLCHTLLGLTAASGPCEDQIVGIFGNRVRNNGSFTIPLSPDNTNNLGLATHTGLGGKNRFVELNAILTGLQDTVDPASSTDSPLPYTPPTSETETQPNNQTQTLPGPCLLSLGVSLGILTATGAAVFWHRAGKKQWLKTAIKKISNRKEKIIF